MASATIQLYNTITGKLEPFEPRVPGKVGVYVCGPTPYNVAHAGHARANLAFDVLVRHLRARGYDVTYVRNLTDVDDKILAAAQASGEDPLALSARMAGLIEQEMKAIGVLRPDVEPRVSQHIDDIVRLIQTLINKGVAYVAETPKGVGRLLLGPQLPRLRQALAPQHRRSARRRAGRGDGGPEAGPARLRPLEGGRRRLGLAEPVGQGAPRLAHRVLRDVGALPRATLRHPRRRDGPHLPAPRERDRAERGGVGQGVLALLAAQRVRHVRQREDEQIARQLRDDGRRPRAQRPGGVPLLPARTLTTADRSPSTSRRSPTGASSSRSSTRPSGGSSTCT